MAKGKEERKSGLIKRDYTIDYQNRPARVQLEYSDSIRVDENGTYNVWYSKWSMDGSKFNQEKKAAEYRCIIDRDSGKTRGNPLQPFCIHFAHGRCTRGHNCTFLHRLPLPGDPIETTIDCFGRDKFRNDREDMGGIGSFERRCKTLYIGNIGLNDHMQEIVTAHFSEWGSIEYVNVLTEKGVAFVQYKSILNAEFAKEAMQNQRLESDDIINVRWAVEDPNPGVTAANKRKAEEIVLESIKSRLPTLGDKGTILDYQDLSSDPRNSKARKKVTGKEKTTELSDTEKWQDYCQQYYEYYGEWPIVGQVDNNRDVSLIPKGNSVYAIPDSEKKNAKQKHKLVADYSSSEED